LNKTSATKSLAMPPLQYSAEENAARVADLFRNAVA